VVAASFKQKFMLSMLPLVALVAFGMHANWKRGRLSEKRRMLLITFAVAVIAACAIVFGIYSKGKILTPVAATLGIWIILTSLVEPIDRIRRNLSLSRSVIGMTVAHIGLGLFILSLTTVESFTIERDVALATGASTTVGPYELRFNGVKPIEGPNYDGVEGTVRVSRHGTPMTVLYPQKRQYYVQHSATTEAAIEMHYGSNILVALGEDLKGGKWSVRIQVRPLVNLVWLAAFIMAVGGWISLFDRRYRIPKTAQDAAPGAVTPSGIAGEHAR